MAWTTQAQTSPPGQSWLQMVTASGSSTPNAPEKVSVGVDQSGLAAGQYYGFVSVAAPNAVNTPQGFSVQLNVVQGEQLGSAPAVSTGGVILVGAAALVQAQADGEIG
jgi:hypothetical protein